MSTDLRYLAYTAMLTAALWAPYIVALVMTNGGVSAANYTDPTPPTLPNWGKRANRVFMNAVESFAPFAALVLIAQAAGKADATTALLSVAFFWTRVAHAIVYWLGIPFIRTLVFGLSFACVVGMFVEVIK
jgi:uncharacterized MAPEG superfamily protein